jgi:hypothetical protein
MLKCASVLYAHLWPVSLIVFADTGAYLFSLHP